MKYVLLDDELYKCSAKGLLLKCLDKEEAMKVMAKVHEGIYKSHRLRPKIRCLIHRYGYYWPTMAVIYISYNKGCLTCQCHGPIQRMLVVKLHLIIKPWPFRGWPMDLIGKIHPLSSKQHIFIMVVINYFSKWVEA